jgi:ribonuclease HI
VASDQARPPAWAVFTDGSCWTKDRIGGWACVAFTDDDSEEYTASGAGTDTTISRMELTGPVVFLEWLLEHQGPSAILVFSDSEYVVLGATDRTRARNKHNDLWDHLDMAVDAHEEVHFEHVKGHDTNYYNHEADRLAGEARKAKQRETQ